jgi:hypothetical protein
MRHRPAALFLATALLLLAGCATTQAPAPVERVPNDAPRQFAVASATTVSGLSDDLPADRCPPSLIDPRDGTELRLVRSAMGKGDYAVPDGTYGIGPEELLRIDCSSGRAVKRVRR